MQMKDKWGRCIDYLRISVTDKCNFRCRYCMPQAVLDVCHAEIMRYEEIMNICEAAVRAGISKFKITGGEPIVRKWVIPFMQGLKGLNGVYQVTVTTNGMYLEEHLPALVRMGVDGINISLDTLDRDQFEHITGTDGLERVLAAVKAAAASGIRTKVNAVLLRQTRSQILPLAKLAEEMPVDVRFIEIMPIGFGRFEKGVTEAEVLAVLRGKYDDLRADEGVRGNGPAAYYAGAGLRGHIGFIAANTHQFCHACNRMRLTSTGFLKPCLCYDAGVDLKSIVRGQSNMTLAEAFARAIGEKPSGHCFSDRSEITEIKTMKQIGG